MTIPKANRVKIIKNFRQGTQCIESEFEEEDSLGVNEFIKYVFLIFSNHSSPSILSNVLVKRLK